MVLVYSVVELLERKERRKFMSKIFGMVAGIVLLGTVLASGAGVLDGVVVVAYTEYASTQEWANSRDILELEDAAITEIETSDADEMRALLVDADVFLIPDQGNSGDSSREAIGEELANVLQDFLTSGGRIVACYWRAAEILAEAGLMTVSDNDTAVGPLVVVDASHVVTTTPFAIPASFSSVNADCTLIGIDDEAEILVDDDYGDPAAYLLPRDGGSIVFLGFDYYEYNSATENLLLNACCHHKFTPDCSTTVVIEGMLEAGASLYDDQKCFVLPPVASMVGIALEGTVNLYLRHGGEVGRSQEEIDYSFVSSGERREMAISGSALSSGYWFIVLDNATDTAQAYSLSIAPIPTLIEIADLLAENGDVMEYRDTSSILETPVTVLNDALRTDGRMLAVQQYVVEVGSEMEAITVRMTADTHANVYLRHGLPVVVDDHAVVADMSGSAESGTATLSLGGGLLQTGTYYIGVEMEPGREYEIEIVTR